MYYCKMQVMDTGGGIWVHFCLWTLMTFSHLHLLMLLYIAMILTFGTLALWACVCIRGANGPHTACIKMHEGILHNNGSLDWNPWWWTQSTMGALPTGAWHIPSARRIPWPPSWVSKHFKYAEAISPMVNQFFSLWQWFQEHFCLHFQENGMST